MDALKPMEHDAFVCLFYFVFSCCCGKKRLGRTLSLTSTSATVMDARIYFSKAVDAGDDYEQGDIYARPKGEGEKKVRVQAAAAVLVY